MSTGRRVAYLVSRFPKLTETFVLGELAEMARLGVALEVYALLRGREAVVDEAAAAWVRDAHYAPFVSSRILRANAYFLRRRPRAYLRALHEVLAGTLGSWNFFIGALGIFAKTALFARDMERRGVTHVHAQFANHPALAAFIVHRLTGISWSFTARGSDIHVNRRFLRQKIEAATFAIAVSEFNRQVMLGECPGAGDKIHVVYGGIDTDRFGPLEGRDAPAERPFQILCIGRLEEVKGHTVLIEACRLLALRGVPFECHLVGDGELREPLARQIAAGGLGGRVHLHGAEPGGRVRERLAGADCLALATVQARNGKREGIPNVFKEAMSCGLPVVGSRISGIPELVEEGISGLLVPPADPPALAAALECLAGDPGLRERLGRAGCERVRRDFDLRESTRRRAELFGVSPARRHAA